MLFTRRGHTVKRVESAEDLARELCAVAPAGDVTAGFQLEQLLFLNDSTGNSDGHVEFAVVVIERDERQGGEGPIRGTQVDSWTITWMGAHQVAFHIRELLAGQVGAMREAVVAYISASQDALLA
jgi:hypothetical protein